MTVFSSVTKYLTKYQHLVPNRGVVDTQRAFNTMAIEFFDSSVPSVEQDLPFAEDYLKANPKSDKKPYQVLEIIKAKSGKGYLLKTEEFVCWIWAKEAITKLLVEALIHMVKQGYGHGIYACLDKKAKGSFRLAADKEVKCMWYGDEKKYTTSEDGLSSGTVVGGNPFL